MNDFNWALRSLDRIETFLVIISDGLVEILFGKLFIKSLHDTGFGYFKTGLSKVFHKRERRKAIKANGPNMETQWAKAFIYFVPRNAYLHP